MIDPAALARLDAHPWPGNVRELRNVMDRAVALQELTAVGTERLGQSATL